MLVRTLRNGQVDVVIYDLKRNRYSPITQDIYDESEAHWVGSTGDVYYVSDRYEDTLQSNLAKEGIKSLYRWNADEPSKVQKIFSHKGEYFNVRTVSDSLIYFLVKQYSGNELVSYHINSDTFSFTPVRSGTWDGFDWVKDKMFGELVQILQKMNAPLLALVDKEFLISMRSVLGTVKDHVR